MTENIIEIIFAKNDQKSGENLSKTVKRWLKYIMEK